MGNQILVVDDEDQVRDVVKQLLETFGYEVVTAADGEEGFTMATTSEDVKLVLTDVVMPRLGGFEMVQRILEVRPDLEVIFMSAYSGDEQLAEQVATGRARFLAKPFKPSELERKVKLAFL